MNTDNINNTIDANKHNPKVNTDDISDGFHTFGQLYFQRMMLFATLVNLFPELSWKTTRHEDGEECFGGGWFLVTIDTPEGSYGYHYRLEEWDKFNCMVLKKAKHWDGYTEENVDRLFSLIDYKKYIQKISGFNLKPCERKRMFDKINGKTMRGPCSECKRIDTCKDKIDVRTVEDDIKYGMVVPNYIPGPNAECLIAERNSI